MMGPQLLYSYGISAPARTSAFRGSIEQKSKSHRSSFPVGLNGLKPLVLRSPLQRSESLETFVELSGKFFRSVCPTGYPIEQKAKAIEAAFAGKTKKVFISRSTVDFT